MLIALHFPTGKVECKFQNPTIPYELVMIKEKVITNLCPPCYVRGGGGGGGGVVIGVDVEQYSTLAFGALGILFG